MTKVLTNSQGKIYINQAGKALVSETVDIITATNNTGSAITAGNKVWVNESNGSYSIEKLKEFRNFNVIGRPTINDSTHIVSGFSINNYLRITDRQSYGTGTITSLYAVFKIHTPTSNNWTAGGRVINGTSAHDDFALHVTSSESTFRFIDSDFENNKMLTVAGALLSDTDYWIKITYDGTTLTGYLSTDGISYTQQGSLTRSSSELYITNSNYTMGSRYDNPAVCVWNGSIDLSETYINVNGVSWWKPYLLCVTENSLTGYAKENIASGSTGDVKTLLGA